MFIFNSVGDSKKTFGGKFVLSARKVEDSELCKLFCGLMRLTVDWDNIISYHHNIYMLRPVSILGRY